MTYDEANREHRSSISEKIKSTPIQKNGENKIQKKLKNIIKKITKK